MIANNIEEKSVENKNKYSNLARPRASPVDFGSPIPSKKSYSLNEKNSVTKNNKLNNKLKSSNNSFSGQEKNIGYLNSSFQSDSSIKYNHHAPSTSSSLVDKIFTSNTPSKKLHFDPNEFSNPETSFYVNSDSILKSNNMSIFSVDSLNENIINKPERRSSKIIDNSDYVRKIEEENSKLENEISELKEELNKINNALLKKNKDIEEFEHSNKITIDDLNNEIEKQTKTIKQLKEKNEYMTGELQKKNKTIEEYKLSIQALKKDINSYETKNKNSEIIIQNLKDENKIINEENLKLKEELEELNEISIEKQKLEDENEHLRLINEELNIDNEIIDDIKNEYQGKPTLMDEIQSEVSSSDQDKNQIENVLKSKLRNFEQMNKLLESELSKNQFENRDLKEKIKLLENQLEELYKSKEKEEKENPDAETITDENVKEIIEQVKKEMIQKYEDKEKQDLIQEIERKNTIIDELNEKKNIPVVANNHNEKTSLISIDKKPILSVMFSHKIQFSLLLLLTWLFGVLIWFIVVEYVVYLAGDYGVCHHLTNQLFFPQAVMQALSSKSTIPL